MFCTDFDFNEVKKAKLRSSKTFTFFAQWVKVTDKGIMKILF